MLEVLGQCLTPSPPTLPPPSSLQFIKNCYCPSAGFRIWSTHVDLLLSVVPQPLPNVWYYIWFDSYPLFSNHRHIYVLFIYLWCQTYFYFSLIGLQLLRKLPVFETDPYGIMLHLNEHHHLNAPLNLPPINAHPPTSPVDCFPYTQYTYIYT